MHISRLPGAGGACTCQRRMCAVWFNPGNSTWGPAARGKQRLPQVGCFKSKGETPPCPTSVLETGVYLPPGEAGSDQGHKPPPQFPPAVTAGVCVGVKGGVQCLQEGAGSWWREFTDSADTVARCPLQAKAWGQVLCPKRWLITPTGKEPEVGTSQRWKNYPQSWPGSCGAGRVHGGLDGQLIWTLGL